MMLWQVWVLDESGGIAWFPPRSFQEAQESWKRLAAMTFRGGFCPAHKGT